VCDRVGSLRAGRLVEVAALDELRRLHRTELDVTFATESPGGLELLPGVEKVFRPLPERAVLWLSGPPGAVLRAVSAADLVRLDVREASLEEIFLDYYGEVVS
jgi:ABC-2 type transport system ATP-binding protein